MKKRFLSLALIVLMLSALLTAHSAVSAAPDPALFDEDNIVLTFAVISDSHTSGTGNQQRAVEKFAHLIDVLNKEAAAEGVTVDAILHDGDIVCALNGTANVASTASSGLKAAQNYRETVYNRSILEGKETNRNDSSVKNAGGSEISVDYGDGIFGTGTKFFYALGNHDEGGKGMTNYNTATAYTKGVRGSSGYYNSVNSAEYFAAVFCGWEYDYQSAAALAADDGYDPDYLDYIELVYQMFANKDNASALATAKANFAAKYSYITPESALEKFTYYYGSDTDFTRDEYGLFYGNRHMKIGDYHFLAVEIKQNSPSAAFVDKWCAQSVAEDPTKPIFILTHYKMKETVYGSFSNEVGTGLKSTLEKYPQAIIWGGHSHTPLANENAIMQQGYTQVETGVILYQSMWRLLREDILSFVDPNYNNNKYFVPDNQNFGENYQHAACNWVQVDANNNVRIKRLDVYRSFASGTDSTGVAFNNPDKAVFYKDPWYITADENRVTRYTAARGTAANDPVPTFPDGATVTYTPVNKGSTTVRFDAATDDDIVKYYFVEAYDGETLVQRKALTSFYNECQDQAQLLALHPTYEATFTGLDDTVDYTFKVKAFDCWNRSNESSPAALPTEEEMENSVFVDAVNGNDANDGTTAATAVKTFAKAQTLASNDTSVNKIYVIGTVEITSNFTFGVKNRQISILGYGEEAWLKFGDARATFQGDVIIDNIKLTLGGKSYAAFRTRQFNLTLGPGVTGDGFNNRSIAQAFDEKVTGSFTTPTVVTYNVPYDSNTGNMVKELHPLSCSNASGATFNGYLRYNIGANSHVNNVYGGPGTQTGAQTMNGIFELNAAADSYIGTLNMTSYGTTVKSDMTSNGLRDFRLNGKVETLFLAGSAGRAATSASTGVAVWTFSPSSKIGSSGGVLNIKQNGIANETGVTHVLIFNNNSYYSNYVDLSAGWTVPNEYVFNVDATGKVEAYMSKLPISASDLTCTLGGVKLISTHTHAIIDEGTANEQTVELAALTDGQFAIANLAEGKHTVTFRDLGASDPVSFDDAAATAGAGYTAETRTSSEKKYAILASFRFDTFDTATMADFGAYFFDADNDEVGIVSPEVATLDTTGGRYYVMIYGIGSPDTSVAVKPFATVAGNVYYGTVLDVVPSTVGCDTYYGPESAVVAHFN